MKSISSNVRTSDCGILHLFEFNVRDIQTGEISEVLRLTDHDIFVTFDGQEYTPVSVTFDQLTEDTSNSANTINVSIENITNELSSIALQNEWRNNAAKIIRVMYQPPAATLDGEVYDYGIGGNEAANVYPNLDLTAVPLDSYSLFDGVIDNMVVTSQAVSVGLTNLFVHWQKTYPERTYSQNEFTTVVDAIVEEIYWGRAT
jgi:hypothetical protein